MRRDEKEELLKKLRQLELVKKEKTLDTFVPTSFQQKFFESQARIRLLTAGNGAGKTISLVIELLWTHLKKHPHRSVADVHHSWFITPGYDKVEDYCEAIKKWCPPSQLPVFDRMGSSAIRRLRWQNGDLTTFFSIDADVGRFEGTNYHKLFIDEPIPRDIYIAALRGLRNSEDWSVCWAMTPISEPWIYEDLYLPSMLKQDPNVEVFTGSSYENPHLSQSFLKDFAERLNDDEKRTRLYGEFAVLQGRVFKEFERAKHVIKMQDWPKDWPVYLSLDVHTRKPNTAVWVGVTRDDDLVVIDECAVEGIEDFASEILRRNEGKYIVSTIVDNSALSQDWSTRSAIQMLSASGVKATPVRPQDKDIANGINKMRRLLKGLPDKVTQILKPRLYIMENCRHTLVEFEMYSWDNYRAPEKAGVKEKPRKIYDDFIDPIRYLVNRGLSFAVDFSPIQYRAGGLYNSEPLKLN